MRELARRELARRRLIEFTKQTHPRYKPGWVHHDICARLERFSQQVIEEKSPRLMLLMPPRHGKSELASIRFPAWHLGKAPHHEIINVGYNLDLPMKFSRKVREVVRDPVFGPVFPQCKLDPESQSAEAWNTTQGGGFTAAGVGGGITGKGAHILIVDDPIKNIEEADSVLVRESLWEWYLSTAYTRLAPGGGVLIIETWWNDDDLAGRLQNLMHTDPEADQFEIVKYPALAEAHEFRRPDTLEILRFDDPSEVEAYKAATGIDELETIRAKGDALHPDRYPVEALKRIKANQTPRLWSALYQQNPVPDEGMYFRKEWFRTVPVVPEPYGLSVFTAWDFAIGEKTHNDWTVGVTVLQDEHDNLFVLEVRRFKGDSLQIVDAIVDMSSKWTRLPGVSYKVGVEDGQIWKSIQPLVKRRMEERLVFPTYEILKPLTDKMARARPLQGRMQHGKVFFPEQAAWFQQAMQEMLRFPAGTHDDVVDALAWVVQLAIRENPPRAVVQREPPSWKEKLDQIEVGASSHMAA